jgi:hypothetical protein
MGTRQYFTPVYVMDLKTHTIKKYHKNPEKYKQYQKEYTNKNKEHINEIRNTKYKCPNCDGIYTYANYCKHILSKKHLISIKNTNPIIIPSN